MKVQLMPEAEEILFEIGMWVEEKNTPGSGERFINSFLKKIAGYALSNVKYLPCKNEVLTLYHLCCIAIGDWIIAFKQTKEAFVVHYIVFGPGLK